VLLAFPIGLYTALRDPFIQTFVVRSAASYLSHQLNSTILIGSFYIDLDLSLEINDLTVYDQQNTVLFQADKVKVRPSANFLKSFSVAEVILEKATVQIVRYENEDDLNMQFILDYFKDSKADSTIDLPASSPSAFRMGHFKMIDGAFRYWDQQRDSPGNIGMDYAHLNITDINLEFRSIEIIGDSVSCIVEQLSAKDTCGVHLKNMQAKLFVSSNGVVAKSFILEANDSHIDTDLTFTYDRYSTFISFIDSVYMNLDVRSSELLMSDLGYFAPELLQMTNKIEFSGQFSGLVTDMLATDFSIKYGEETQISGNVRLTGLPDIYTTRADLKIKNLATTVPELLTFKIPTESGIIPLPDEIRVLNKIRMIGSFEGYYDDFLANINLNTSMGSVFSDVLVRKNARTTRIHYSGQVKARNVNLAGITGSSYAPENINLDLQIDGKGVSFETIDARLEGSISSMVFLGNVFKDVRLAGNYAGDEFNGTILIDDDKLKLSFVGLADFSADSPLFNFDLDILNADLYRLNLLKSDTVMKLSAHILADFTGLSKDDLNGQITVENTTYNDSRGEYKMNQLSLKASDDELFPKRIKLISDFFDFEMAGTINFQFMEEAFRQFLSSYITFESLTPATTSFYDQDFFISLNFKKTEELRRLFLPSLLLSDNASFSGVFTNRSQMLNTTFSADLIGFNNFKIKDVLLKTSTDRWQANIMLSGNEIIFRDSTKADSTVLGINKPKFTANILNDSILFKMNWNDEELISRNRGSINGFFKVDSAKSGELRITHADLIVNDSIWNIEKGNRIVVNEDYTLIENLVVSLGAQQIALNGHVPLYEADSLQVKFVQWDLSNFDLLTRGSGIDLDGIITGELMMAHLSANPAFSSNLHLNNLMLNSEKLGDARVLSSWSNENESIYLNAQLINVGNISTSRMLNMTGFYYPLRKSNSLDFDINLDNFRLKTIAPFMKGVLSRVEGLASGDFTLSGSIKKPELAGKLNLQRTGFLIDYLNTAYSLSHEFIIEPEAFLVKDLILYDTMGNKASVNGRIKHDFLRNFWFDIHVEPVNFLALNTNSSMNELFYGSAKVNGDVFIRGTLDDIFMNISATTRRGTEINIPFNTTTTVSDNDFVIFVQPIVNPDLPQTNSTKPISSQNIDISLETNITPDAGVKIFLPGNMGDLAAQGFGNIKLGYNSRGEFSLIGEYIVNNGQFNFAFENLVRRRFELLEGGRISWTGDPYDAELDIKGLYRVKTSVSSLGFVIDSTSNLRNRINVDCIIHLTQQLFNPTIRFSINLPNADDDIRQLVFSTLDTTNDALMTQQMISLLVLGSFSYATSEAGAIGSSSLNLLSNQLSNWLSQISKDFDVGLHYKPGDQISNEELEVALSTQLFNDRITIDGNFGVTGSRVPSQNASNLVGDIDVNFILTKDGRLRLKAFNHSNTNSWYNTNAFENIAPYTQGVGVTYKQEFDNFGELFRNKRKTRKAKKPEL